MITATQAAVDAETAADIIGKVAAGASVILPWIELFGGILPGFDSVLAALQIAAPIMQKVAKVAPVVSAAIADGMPIFAAIDKAGPTVLPDLKMIYATLANGDPTIYGTELKPEDVSNDKALEIAAPVILGRRWTDEERERWFERASGQQTNQF